MSDPFADRMDAFEAIQSQRNFSVQHEKEVLAAQANVATARAPDLAAKANEASRATGIPAGAYDAEYLKIFDTQRKQAAIEKVGVKYPKVATFLANPDNAAVAQDDVDNLGVLARTWDETKRFALRAPVTMSSGLWGALSATTQTIAKYNPGANLQRAIFGSSIDDALASYANQKSVEGRDIVQANQTRVKNFVGRNLIQGLDSTVTTATGIAAGVLTRNPEATLAIMGAQTGGSEFQKARDAGKSLEQSIFYGAQQGTIEALTEKIPASKLLGDLAAKTPFAKTLFNQLTSEIPGEQVATFMQDLTEWANLHPEKTIGQFLEERPQAALETLIQTASGTMVQTSASKAVDASLRVADKVVNKVFAAREAQQSSESLDKLAAAAEASKTRTRDPQAYESLVAALSADTGAENIYIPAEKVREYLQSNDWDSVEFWQEYDQEIADGTISNGDVVVPVSKAITHLAGTPAWEALKGDMRLSPGGMSMNEAQEADKGLPQEIDRLSDEVSAQLEADRAAAEPRQKLFDTALQKLHEAGQTLSEATKNAMLVANRYATRAARLGREVTGNEFDNVKVQQILPAGLAPMVAADNLSLVIRAMRRGKAVKDKSGPSLLEWIASKGGIEDRGGDLKAMGADKWHKGKVGQKKLLRSFNRGQMSMLGSDGQQNSNSPDELAMRAWEAGYFPEFTERPSVNDLLNAIAEGVAGRDRYIPDSLQPDETDQMRLAAQDLAQLLDQAGLDPEKASENEIKQAVQRYQEQASRGQGFDQVDPRSEAFKAWFGDSKVVDENGDPLVVYHGTNQDVSRFVKKRGGQATTKNAAADKAFFFTSDVEEANQYAENAASRVVSNIAEFEKKRTKLQQEVNRLEQQARRTGDWDAYEKAMSEWEDLEISATQEDDLTGRNIMPVYLSLQNPLVADFASVDGEMRVGYLDRLAVKARKEGHDGLILRNISDSPKGGITSTHYAVFDPTQIKSINNRGTFDPNDARILFQSAYHGSPHIFDKFSLEAIGSGEGAQAYGWGLYFAGKKEIAQHYRDRLSRKNVDDAEMISVLRDGGVKGMRSALAQVAVSQDGRIAAEDHANWTGEPLTDDMVRAFAKAIELREAAKGRLYHVEIPEDDQYLLWDAPLNEQPEKVRKSLDAALTDYGTSTKEIAEIVFDDGDVNKLTGARIYSKLADFGGVDGQERASKLLRDAGIAGIKYLDGGSRADGDGSYNYVVFDDNAVSIKAYEQSYSDGPRGRVTFDNGMAVIDLFQQRDLSTFIHEMGHVWLEELQADAALPEAPQQLRDDLQAVFDWFAANGHPVVDGVIPVEAHEMWARGIERYTLEGKAPSSALRRAFEAFRAWMLSIYHLADNLRSPITPEIRGVMDRLIATDEEIQQASEEQNLKALFDSVEAAAKFGMNEAAYKDYVKSATEAKDEAFDRLLFKTMETVRRERTKAYKDERDAVAADVRSSVDARPVFRALASLRAVNGLKLDKQWLINTYGEDVLASLPKGVPPIYKDGGVDADMIAEASGFSTGDEMVKALIGVEDRRASLREGGDKRSARDSIIDEETDAIMKERYGDPLSDGSIEEEALALIHNEKQGELQATELRVLSSKTKAETRATPYRIARLWAADKIRNGQVKDVASRAAIQRYLRAAAKAGKAAEQAYMAGDTDEAFKQKQAQMLNNALVAEAKQAADAIDIAVARMSRLAKRRTIKSMDQDYLERIHDLLESVDLKERTQASIDRQGSFEEWRAEQEAKGYDIVTPPGFAESIGKTHWSRLTVEKLLGLDETVKQIAHLGRYKQQLIDNKVKREFDEVVAEAQASIAKLPPKPPSDLMEPSRWDAIKSRVASMDASLLKMETVFDWLDSGDSNGVFNRIVFRPIADAQDREKAMLTDYTGRLTDLLKAIPKEQLKRWSEKVSLPELLNRETGNPWVMTREQLVSMALNMGNAGNIQRLVDGYGWNEEAVRRVLNRELTAADWQYVQGVWDTIDSLWPEIAAMERRVNGVEPEKVEAVPLVTAHGTLRGGYFPAIYDPRKSIEAEANAAKASDIFENTYTKATTRASSTKERSDKVKRPIHLSLSVINRHVGEVIHDITHREVIMQADKFLTSKRIMKAVDETLGPEVRKQFRPWLHHIANEWANDRKGVAGWDAFAKKLRTNTSIVGMGFRLSTIVMQVAGYSNSFEKVGAKWVSPQLAKAVDPRAYRFVMERSSEVRNRMDTLERDVRENVKQLAGRTDLIANARKFAFYGIGYMDRVVVIPTWLGAYNRGISEGMSEADAGYYADKAVRQSQGAGAAKDLAAVQRSNEWMRLATMFYSYQSAIYQRFRSLGRDARTAGVRDVPDLIARSFWLIVVPPLLSELLAGRGPDDDEDWGMWSFQKMLAGLFGPIPIARDVVNAAQSGFGYSFTPAARAFETGLNVWTDAGNLWEGDDTKRATRNVLELSGYTLGLPTGQLASSTQFIVDVSEGEQDPQTITDWMEGLSKGKLSED